MSLSPITILVPIYNAPVSVARCLESLDTYTPKTADVLLINDGSTDTKVGELLELWRRKRADWRLIDRQDNRGFTRTVNQGLLASEGDVVLLNSDTRVTRGWLESLHDAAHLAPHVASATPFSNAASICSLLEYCEERPLPGGVSEHDVAAALRAVSPRAYPLLPTGVGFCLYMRRSAIERVGWLDELGFPRGYGEENDWCERAKHAGLVHVLADDAFVFHEGSASFSHSRAALSAQGTDRLRQRWPSYFADVVHFVQSRALIPYVELVRWALPDIARHQRSAFRSTPKILQIVHAQPFGPRVSGTEFHVQQLLDNEVLCDAYEQSTTWPTDRGCLFAFPRGKDLHTLPISFERPNVLLGGRTEHESWSRLLAYAGPTVAHVHHALFWGVPFLDWLTDRVPTVVTLHDHFCICPRFNLLRSSDQSYCGIPEDLGECKKCLDATALRQVVRIESWRKDFRRVLAKAEALIAPSEWIRNQVSRVYPELRDKITVLGHPLWPAPRRAALRDCASGRLRVLVLGYTSVEKGSEHLTELSASLPTIDFVSLGSNSLQLTGCDNVSYLGGYDHSSVYDMIERARCDVALFLSRTPESFSFTFSEAVSAGLPVLVPNVGALYERLQRLDCGWSYAADLPLTASDVLRRLDGDRALVARMQAQVARVRPSCGMDEYGQKLKSIYEVAARRAVVAPRHPQPTI